MAFDSYLAERIKKYLTENHLSFREVKMMGGLCFMMNEKMLCGLLQDKKDNSNLLMARIGEAFYQEALSIKHTLPMDFTGRPMKGYIFIKEDGFDSDEDLEFWIQKCIDFNPIAKSSKSKKRN